MATINSIQDQQVTYISGVTSNGLAAELSYWTWNLDSPPTYDASEGLNYTVKFGSPTSGTGAAISFSFDAASEWTGVEKAAFVATAKLWSAVANVTITEDSRGLGAVSIVRRDDDVASGGQNDFSTAVTGTNQLGTAGGGRISVDAAPDAFGPLGDSLATSNGYAYETLIHEWGHVLGLGHAGPYDSGLDIGETPFTAYDNRAWTVMSYVDEPFQFNFGSVVKADGFRYGKVATTPMMLDILAIQRMYGVAVDTPLSGGQTYGFNSNIAGEIHKFFDFTENSRPIVTLWNKGLNNVLDLSGFTSTSSVDLHDGAFSSVAGLSNNVGIAYGTRIDTAITGAANDAIMGNDNGNVIMAGAGSDSINGGNGNDHLYGAAATATPGDGPDAILGGGGSDYIQGNAGNDLLSGNAGSDRIQGGQGNDIIDGGAGNDSVNGNLGDDMIDGGDDSDSLRGGQGNDSLSGGAGNDLLQGDLGNDSLAGGGGVDLLTGGGGSDLFVFAVGDATPSGSATDGITDFTDGDDRIRLGQGAPSNVLQGQSFEDFAAAAASAQQMLGSQGSSSVAALRIGSDSYIFYATGPSAPIEAIRLAGLSNPALIGTADFA